MTAETPRVLSIDDDPVFQRFVELSLKRAGYEVVTAGDGIAGRECLQRLGAEAFDCVLTDYRMPRMDGLSFLDWLHHEDSSLAAILVTAEGEKKHVEQSLRSGACNFLDKPVMSDELRATVADAIEVTAERRRAVRLREQVERVGQIQRSILSSFGPKAKVTIDLFFRPKHQIGGDFLDYLRLSKSKELILVSDVSGHDVTAAHASAFFHGVLHGMLECSASFDDVLSRYNKRLLRSFSDVPEATSIALSSLLFDYEAGTMTALSCGAPSPVWMEDGNLVRSRGREYSSPLGWFDDLQPVTIESSIPSSPVWLWTDGLEDLASQLGAAPLSVAHALFTAKAAGTDPEWFARAADDVLVARVTAPSRQVPPPLEVAPLVAARYGPEQAAKIDCLQSFWEKSIRVALPQVTEECLFSVLLAAREAVLNATLHGCQADQTAQFQIDYLARKNILRVHVSDPGPGHSFDPGTHEGMDLEDAHRGLLLIRGFASRVVEARNGAELILEFSLN